MRIGWHLQAFRPGEIGGLEVYVRALVSELLEIDPELELVLVGTAEGLHTFDDRSGLEKVELTHEDFARLDADRIAHWELDLWFCPLLALEPSEPGLPTVVTIPDLQHESHPEFFDPEILAWRHRHYPRTVARAEWILTLSQHAGRQIVDHLGADPDRVVAIPLDGQLRLAPERAGDASYLEEVRRRYHLPARYFFFPGNLWPHKNHANLFRALALLRRDRPDRELVLTGAEPEGEGAAELPGLEQGVRYLGYVPTEDLAGLYASSLGLVFPSLYEGFGLPVVEAMRIGCPVACSDRTSLPEIGGDAVLYFDPEDPEQIAYRMGQLDDGGTLRDELVAAGCQRARRFSWRETARGTLEVFRSVVESGRREPAEVRQLPSISIVVPSYQQATFLPRTLDSVLGQGIPDLQVIVVDGGSKDGSIQILEQYRARYPERLEFVSEPDRGQAHAVNKGLARARGEIVGWLNSDDTYAPFALLSVARTMASRPAVKVLYGRADYIDVEDLVLGPYPVREGFDREALAHECFLCQPAVFWRRELVEEGFHLNEDLQSCMDYELWIRLGREQSFHFLDRTLARSRIYPENKTLARRDEVFDEVFRVVDHHYRRIPVSWVLGRAVHRLERGNPELAPPADWRAKVLALATLVRRHWSRPGVWPALGRELRSALGGGQRARRRGNRVLAPGSWSGLAVKGRVARACGTPLLVREQGSGRVLGRVALDSPGHTEAVIGLPRRRSGARDHRLVLDGDLEALGQLELVAHPLLPAAGRNRLSLPASWSSAEISLERRDEVAGSWFMLFRHRGREIARWSFSGGGGYRRWLPLPDGAAELEVMVEPSGGAATWIEIQEGPL